MAMLSVSDLAVSYGAIKAVKGISFDIDEGEIVTLIGANGAGKSTTLNTIAGLIKPDSGSIKFSGEELVGIKPHKIVERGLALCPEGRRVFTHMTVSENLDMGGYTANRCREQGDARACLRALPAPQGAHEPGGGYAHPAASRQMLAMGPRPHEPAPSCLMLDEPSMGPGTHPSGRDFEHHPGALTRTAPRSSWSSRAPTMALRCRARRTCWRTGKIVKTGTGARALSWTDDVRKGLPRRMRQRDSPFVSIALRRIAPPVTGHVAEGLFVLQLRQ
jgi:branched-chain amino acid transport system ATP-binding protein